MANACDYVMAIRGTKENCYKWFEKLHSVEYEVEGKVDDEDAEFDCFYYMDYECEPEITKEERTGEDYVMAIQGVCCWSLETCCRAKGYSEGTDLFALFSRELSIEMEVWSIEPGAGFIEHYRYKNGECLIDEVMGDVFYV